MTTRTLLLVNAIEIHTLKVMFSFITFHGKPLDLDLPIVLCLLDFYTILKSDNIILKHCWHISGNKIYLTLSLNTSFSVLHQSTNFSIVFTLSFALNFFSNSGSSSASSARLVAAIFERQVVQNNIVTGSEDFHSCCPVLLVSQETTLFRSKWMSLGVLDYHWKCQRKPLNWFR